MLSLLAEPISTMTFTTASRLSGGTSQGKLLPPRGGELMPRAGQVSLRGEISPNPVSHNLTMTSNVKFVEGATLQIVDIQGRVLANQKLSEGSTKVQVEVGNYQAGMYLLVLRNNEQTVVKKFIKE